MIIESGVIVALGLILLFFKLSWRARLRMLGFPLAMDLGVFILLNWLHWGTFSGMMVAATGALVCSSLISIGRKVYGYIDHGMYFPGRINVHERIK
jgi:hypothetical protein